MRQLPTRKYRLSVGLLILAAALLAGCVDSTNEPAEPGKATTSRALESAPEAPFDFESMTRDARKDKAHRAVDDCRAGELEACYELGDMYHGGDGIRRDNALSVRLIDHACQHGFEWACYDMGVRYHLGVEVDQDFRTARVYFQHACEQRVALACHMLGEIARGGIGLSVDTDLAATFYERACSLGYEADCDRLGWPIEHDLERHEWLIPADAPQPIVEAARVCDRGLMSGCVQLAQAYEDGTVIPRDIERAYELYESACDWGALEACQVYRGMSAAR